MDKEFKKYKDYCRKKNIKECRFDSLRAYLEEREFKRNKKRLDFQPLNVILPLSNENRLEAIEDFYTWAYDEDISLDFGVAFIKYKNFLLGGKIK